MLPAESNPISDSDGLSSNNLTDKPSKVPFWEHIHQSTENRMRVGLHRERVTTNQIGPTRIERKGQVAINFGANDYLGLAWHPALRSIEESGGASRHGSGASPIVTGHTFQHEELANAIKSFENAEDAIVFSSGYAANLGTVAALASREDIVFSDELNHASLIDGCRLSRTQVVVYPHGDVVALRQLVRENRHRGHFAFVATDSVFSMDGDLAPLNEINSLCEEFEMQCILDEAHATGVYGHFGRGLAEHLGVAEDRLIRIGTLSKAVGCSGGFVAGRKLLIDWLANQARSWTYSTSSTIPNAAAAALAIKIMQGMHLERSALQKNAFQLRSDIAALGFTVGQGDSPIIPVFLGDPVAVTSASRRLMELGVYIPAIRPPTVPVGKSLLRISLSSLHSIEERAKLVDALKDL